ncbi:hypothetical protein BU16DRAFT_371380 [Lophium mytilinum]|uniref:Uncharacterized protein n=1 Tax=Lophium mytilinum TaxID=390894 RepID=A0A6A6QX64_9PEZI|nr:hypothetical protein BU16DRAFT_371380 [Lophium mytilinum]
MYMYLWLMNSCTRKRWRSSHAMFCVASWSMRLPLLWCVGVARSALHALHLDKPSGERRSEDLEAFGIRCVS